MGVWQRMTMIFRSKANKALDRAEDPREMLDYSYQRQTELLSKVRRGVADVATSRKRVELQINQLEQQSTKLQGQAEKAIGVDREDLAREALTRKSAVTNQISDLKVQLTQLQGEEEKLTLAQQRLSAKVEAFRTRKETIKATYTAAEAQTRINEAVAGHRRGDGRRRPRDPAGRGQDRPDAGPGRCRRRADRLRRPRRHDADRRARRHQPRARGDELAVRRRVRARPAEVGLARWAPSRAPPRRAPSARAPAASRCRPAPRRHPSQQPEEGRA